MHDSDSSALLARARQGSREALDRLFADCGGRLLALIRLRLGPGLRASLESRDVLQETFLSAFQHVDQFRGSDRGALMAWLVGIAENEIRHQAAFQGRRKRDARRAVPLDEEVARLAAPVCSASSRLVFDERRQRLERALERLPDALREIIVLRRLQELSFPEIAERLGKSADACRMQFARAMAALTLEMREEQEAREEP
jgi:RNA polymerase sigma-70 factor (ECF subfamily)